MINQKSETEKIFYSIKELSRLTNKENICFQGWVKRPVSEKEIELTDGVESILVQTDTTPSFDIPLLKVNGKLMQESDKIYIIAQEVTSGQLFISQELDQLPNETEITMRGRLQKKKDLDGNLSYYLRDASGETLLENANSFLSEIYSDSLLVVQGFLGQQKGKTKNKYLKILDFTVIQPVKKGILIVEDQLKAGIKIADSIESLHDGLYSIETFLYPWPDNIKEAIPHFFNYVQEIAPQLDLIVLDYYFGSEDEPDTNCINLGLLKYLKSYHIPIFSLTASLDPRVYQTLGEHGVEQVFVKGENETHFIQEIYQLLYLQQTS
jgi:hypothetical protein